MSFSHRLQKGNEKVDYDGLLNEVDSAATAAQQRQATGSGGANRTVNSSFEDRRKAGVVAGAEDTNRRVDTQGKTAQVAAKSDTRNAQLAAGINKAKSDVQFANKTNEQQYKQGVQDNRQTRDESRKSYANQMRDLDFKDYVSRMTNIDKIIATKNDQKAQWEVLRETARHGFKIQEIEQYTKSNIAQINRDWEKNKQQLELAFEELKRKYLRDSKNAEMIVRGTTTAVQSGVDFYDKYTEKEQNNANQ